MKKGIWIACFAFLGLSATAQTKFSEALVIANGGSGTIGKFVPETSNYSDFANHYATSTQDIVIDNKSGIAYVGLVDSIIAYDVISESRLFGAACNGVTGLHISDNSLWVAKGFGASSNFLEERSLTDLSIVNSFSNVNDQSAAVQVLNDTAFVTVPGAWGSTIGRVALVDASTGSFIRMDSLGTSGVGIGRIFIHDNTIHTISDHGYLAPDFSIHKFVNGQWQESSFAGTTSGYAGAAVVGDSLFLEVNQEVRIIDLSTMQLTGAVFTDKLLSELVYDDVNQKYYGTQQSYTANGQLYVFDATGNIEDSLTVGTAAEAIVLAQNNRPQAFVDLSYGINNLTLTLFPTLNDVDENIATIEVVEQVNNGTSIVAGTSLEISAGAGYIGEDSLHYSVTDIWGRRDTAAVSLRWVDELNAQVVDFEDVTFNTANTYDGSDGWGGFPSRGALFPTVFNYNFWLGGFAASNQTDTTTPGFTNTFSSYAGSGVNNSDNFGMANGTSGQFFVNSGNGQEISGLWLTNSTYAALSMRNGDAFAKQFGGATGDDPDFFRVTFIGVDKNGNKTDSVTSYLADYRFADNSEDFILKDWTWVDLSSLGTINTIQYKLESSDNGMFGMNTPAFFCVDNINDITTSTNDLADGSNTLGLYPNPATSEVRFTEVVSDVRIFNLSGSVVFQGSNVTRVDVSTLPSGLYVIDANFAGERSQLKLIVE
jgi:hypothetical protein